MPDYDFEVDLQALYTAADEARKVIELKKEHDIEDFVPAAADLASSELAAAFDEFQSRWERGINNLTDDLEEAAGRLAKVTKTYMDFGMAAAEAATEFENSAIALSDSPLLGGSS